MKSRLVSGISRKHAHSLQRLYSLALNFGTFANAKDQASLFRDGLLRKTRHHVCMRKYEIVNQVQNRLGSTI